jgi:hypothetical protein
LLLLDGSLPLVNHTELPLNVGPSDIILSSPPLPACGAAVLAALGTAGVIPHFVVITLVFSPATYA